MTDRIEASGWIQYVSAIKELDSVTTLLSEAQRQASKQQNEAKQAAERKLEGELAKAGETISELERSLQRVWGYLSRVQYQSLLSTHLPSTGTVATGANKSDISREEKEIDNIVSKMAAIREDERRKRFEAEEAERKRLAELERKRIAAAARRRRLIKAGGIAAGIILAYTWLTGLI